METLTEKCAPIKVVQKRCGIIEVWPSLYFAFKSNGEKYISERYSDCLEFLTGHKAVRV